MKKGKSKEVSGKGVDVYYEVYVYGAGVISNCETLEKAIEMARTSSTAKKITKVTRIVLEVGI